MQPHRRPLPQIIFPILLAASMFGILMMRREEEREPTKLPEDLTGAVKKVQRAETLAALRDAAAHGLQPADYLSDFDAASETSVQDAALLVGMIGNILVMPRLDRQLAH